MSTPFAPGSTFTILTNGSTCTVTSRGRALVSYTATLPGCEPTWHKGRLTALTALHEAGLIVVTAPAAVR